VVDQDPVATTLVDEGSEVTIWVAKAPPEVPLPDFTGKTLAEAQALAIQVGVNLAITETVDSTVPVGQIISQDPAAGTSVPKGSDVKVVISAAPATVTLPDVTCLSYGSAKSQLTALGLNVVNGGTAPVLPQCTNTSRIASMSPGAGSTVNVGSSVTLFTGEAAPSPTPSESPTP